MATGQGGSFNGGRLLSEISQKDPRLGQLLQNIVDAVNTSAKNAGVSPVGDIQAPKAPDSVKVNVSGEMAHRPYMPHPYHPA